MKKSSRLFLLVYLITFHKVFFKSHCFIKKTHLVSLFVYAFLLFFYISCMSSGISCGLSMPGTVIWNLRLSSWAFFSVPSRSSKKRSESSSPVNSRIWTRKSRRCSLKAGMSWSRLNKPWTVILIWLSVRWGNAVRKRFATKSWNLKRKYCLQMCLWRHTLDDVSKTTLCIYLA